MFGGASVKEPPASPGNIRDAGPIPELGRTPGGGIPVFLPEEFHGQKTWVGHSQRGCKESDMTEHLSTSHNTFFSSVFKFDFTTLKKFCL